jgi:hypothetical protein
MFVALKCSESREVPDYRFMARVYKAGKGSDHADE